MTQKKLKIVFMGTPDFAVRSLQLLKEKHEIVAVITAPDRPAGRGRKLTPSPVKQYALDHQLNILQPTNLKKDAFRNELIKLNADLYVVVAFRMLPRLVWEIPPLGTINLHASLLPDYRGAAPINHAIIKGEKVTGVTTFFINESIDTGDILLQEKVKIRPNDTAGTLHDKLMETGAGLLLKTVNGIAENKLKPVPQSKKGESFKQAPKIFREDCKINWQQTAQNIEQFIRGLNPYPGAFTSFNGKTVKIYSAKIVDTLSNKNPGEITAFKDKLKVTCVDNLMLEILELQSEGKRKMPVEEWLKGIQLARDDRFE